MRARRRQSNPNPNGARRWFLEAMFIQPQVCMPTAVGRRGLAFSRKTTCSASRDIDPAIASFWPDGRASSIQQPMDHSQAELSMGRNECLLLLLLLLLLFYYRYVTVMTMTMTIDC